MSGPCLDFGYLLSQMTTLINSMFARLAAEWRCCSIRLEGPSKLGVKHKALNDFFVIFFYFEIPKSQPTEDLTMP